MRAGEGFSTETYRKGLSWEERESEIYASASRNGVAAGILFEITPMCNLGCRMCFIKLTASEVSSQGGLLTADEWIDIARQAVDQGALDLIITGGEPFTHPEFMKIYEETSKMGLRIDLYTNSVLLNDEIMDLFVRYPPSQVSITLYGASRETYQKVCGNADAFDMTIKNMRRLRDELKNTPLNIRTTIIRENLDDHAAMWEIAKELGVEMSMDYGTYKHMRGGNSNILSCRLSPIELAEASMKIFEQRTDVHGEQLSEMIEAHRLELEEYKGNISKKDIKITPEMKAMWCRAGSSQCTISWDGCVMPCNVMSGPRISLESKSFVEAWQELRELRKTITKPDRCFKCRYEKYCARCPAEVQSESGAYLDEEPFSCMYCEA